MEVRGHSETTEVNISMGKDEEDEACYNYPHIGFSIYLATSRLVCKDMQNSLVLDSDSRYEYPSQYRELDSEGSQRT